MADPQTIKQAGYIFSVGKMIRHHVFDSLPRLEINGRDNGCTELSMAQMNLLMAVRGHEDLTLTSLADLLTVSPPSASVMVDRLVERGMLHRDRSTRDRRKVVIGLTSDATLLLEKMEEKMLTAFIGLVEELGADTAQKWAEVLQRVEEVLEKQNKVQGGK